MVFSLVWLCMVCRFCLKVVLWLIDIGLLWVMMGWLLCLCDVLCS